MNKSFKIFFAISVLFLAGRFLPGFFIVSNVEKYSGDEKNVAKSAVFESDLMINKMERLWISAKKMEEIEKTSNDSACDVFPFGENVAGHYVATVKVYTLFGLPYGKIKVSCGEASFERFF